MEKPKLARHESRRSHDRHGRSRGRTTFANERGEYFSDGRYSVDVKGGSVTQGRYYVHPDDPAHEDDPHKGKMVTIQSVTILAKAAVDEPSVPSPVTAYARQTLQVRDAPLFSHAVFYKMDLEFHPGPEMVMNRWNGNLQDSAHEVPTLNPITDEDANPVMETVETPDGFSERAVLFSGNGLFFSMRALPGLLIDPETGGASARLTNPLVPANRLDVFLFPPGVFLSSVTADSMLGYVRGLEKTHGENLAVENADDLVPGKTFKVFGERWGNVRYTLADDDGAEKSVSEFFVLLDGRTLVLRLEGSPEWITARSGAVRSALSTLRLR